MGVDISDLVEAKELELKSLAGKRIAIDAFNTLYQFLAIIRQPDGTPLMDNEGRVTSHLSGLFYRTAKLMELGILPSFVFDGKPPQLKADTIKKRGAIKVEAKKKWKDAVEKEDLKSAKKYAQATSKLDERMIDDSKALLDALGIPWVQSPSEGEAQAALICKENDVYAVGSQDFDSLLFGAPRFIRNITITGKRKIPGKSYYYELKPVLITLADVLKQLDVTQEQLIEIGIMIGTDFNPGIKGIGPKKALKAVKEGTWKEHEYGIDPELVKKIFTKPEVTTDYELKWGQPDLDKLLELLHEKHDFSKERVENTYNRLAEAGKAKNQSSLDQWG
ncbi:MAG: flap endonuclease-1 [archaeon]